MSFINQKSRLYWRLGTIALTIPSALIGFAGLRITAMHLNGQRQDFLANQQRIERIESEAKAAIAQVESKQAEAEAYTQLGLRQATCGDTLQRFYFQPGVPASDQLNAWGFDWQAPRYNSPNWYPLFDSNGLLFAAIRKGEIVQADVTPMDQVSICKLNQLKSE
ncbi:hypothetical protein [Almyronema epifaneia]|uniref:Uncharacterized protein n=1 Tax=Almyronema epifaneia S1 TaxID=2991925 RepID=A0ABW6IK19_9CYAN